MPLFLQSPTQLLFNLLRNPQVATYNEWLGEHDVDHQTLGCIRRLECCLNKSKLHLNSMHMPREWDQYQEIRSQFPTGIEATTFCNTVEMFNAFDIELKGADSLYGVTIY